MNQDSFKPGEDFPEVDKSSVSPFGPGDPFSSLTGGTGVDAGKPRGHSGSLTTTLLEEGRSRPDRSKFLTLLGFGDAEDGNVTATNLLWGQLPEVGAARRLSEARVAAFKRQAEEKERAERERAEKERQEKERAERERAEKEREEREHAERERAEKEREEKVHAERERAEKEREEKEHAERERAEREREERDHAERERAEREREEAERAEQEQAEVAATIEEDGVPSKDSKDLSEENVGYSGPPPIPWLVSLESLDLSELEIKTEPEEPAAGEDLAEISGEVTGPEEGNRGRVDDKPGDSPAGKKVKSPFEVPPGELDGGFEGEAKEPQRSPFIVEAERAKARREAEDAERAAAENSDEGETNESWKSPFLVEAERSKAELATAAAARDREPKEEVLAGHEEDDALPEPEKSPFLVSMAMADVDAEDEIDVDFEDVVLETVQDTAGPESGREDQEKAGGAPAIAKGGKSEFEIELEKAAAAAAAEADALEKAAGEAEELDIDLERGLAEAASDLDLAGARKPEFDVESLFRPIDEEPEAESRELEPWEDAAAPGAAAAEKEIEPAVESSSKEEIQASADEPEGERSAMDDPGAEDEISVVDEAGMADRSDEPCGDAGLPDLPELDSLPIPLKQTRYSVAYATEQGRMVAPCPNCTHLLNVNTGMIGVSGKCPSCRTPIVAGERRESGETQLIVSVDSDVETPEPVKPVKPAKPWQPPVAEVPEAQAAPVIAKDGASEGETTAASSLGIPPDAVPAAITPPPGAVAVPKPALDEQRIAENAVEAGRKRYSPPPPPDRVFPHGGGVMEEARPKTKRKGRAAKKAILSLIVITSSLAVYTFIQSWNEGAHPVNKLAIPGANGRNSDTPSGTADGPGLDPGKAPVRTDSAGEKPGTADRAVAGGSEPAGPVKGFEVKPGTESIYSEGDSRPEGDATPAMTSNDGLSGFKLAPGPGEALDLRIASVPVESPPSITDEAMLQLPEGIAEPSSLLPRESDALAPGVGPGSPVEAPAAGQKGAVAGSAPEESASPPVPPLGELGHLDERDRMSAIAKHTLESFMKSRTVEEKIGYVLHPEEARGEMEAYFADHEEKRFEGIISLEGILQDEDTNLWVSAFNIWEPGSTAYVLVYVVGDEERGQRVDWNWYYQVRGEGLKEFFAEPREDSKLVRAVLRRTHFYGEVSKDQPEPLSVRIETPFTQDFSGSIYLDPLSPIAQQLRRQLKWSQERMATVEISWVDDNSYGLGKRVAIKRFLGWGLALDQAF